MGNIKTVLILGRNIFIFWMHPKIYLMRLLHPSEKNVYNLLFFYDFIY